MATDSSAPLKITRLLAFLNIQDTETGDQDLISMDDQTFDEFVRDPSSLVLNSEWHQEQIEATFIFLHQVASAGVKLPVAATSIPQEVTAVSAPKRKYIVAVFKWPLNIPMVHSVGKSLSRVTGGKIPKSFYHAGIVVYNTLHHFGPAGLQQLLEMPADWVTISEFGLQTTERTRNEFDHWMHAASERFKAANYHFAKFNCISFTQELAEFLGVQVDSDILHLQKWLRTEHIRIEEMEDGTLREEATLRMNAFLKALTENPVITALEGSGVRLKRSSASLHSTKEGVKASVANLFQVEAEMESLFTLSNTGGLYDKTIGALLP